MSTNAFQILLLLAPTAVLVLRLVFLHRFLWAVVWFVFCVLVGTFAGGVYCEDCSSRAPSFFEAAIYLAYTAGTVFSIIRAKHLFAKRSEQNGAA